MYPAVVPPSLVNRSDIHQKSVTHYSVVGVSISYLTPAGRVSWALVGPPVADCLTTHRQSCHITDQKKSCAQSDIIISNVHFSSSIVSLDPYCNSCYSCGLYGWCPTVTPSPSYNISPFLPISPSYLI